MFIRKLKDCEEIIAGDLSILRELLHADKGEFKFGYSLAHAVVNPGGKTKKHRLKNSEVYYLTEGEGFMHINNETSKVCPGSAIYIPPGAEQYIENIGTSDLKFLCIVDPAWRPEDDEVL